MHRLILILLALVFVGCRGQVSDAPPIHIVPNMDDQERFDAQEANPFFGDDRAARLPVPGTVARGTLRLDPVLHQGLTPDGLYVLDNPLEVSEALLKRGREQFDIFCAVCHDRLGTGRGMILRYPADRGYAGFPPPPSFHEERIREMPDGQMFEVITHGVRTMPAYGMQIGHNDRWAIIAYVRALQRSQQAQRADVPRETLDMWESR